MKNKITTTYEALIFIALVYFFESGETSLTFYILLAIAIINWLASKINYKNSLSYIKIAEDYSALLDRMTMKHDELYKEGVAYEIINDRLIVENFKLRKGN